MAHTVTLIPGDGTGPELTAAARRVLEATGVAFDWEVHEAGVDVMEKYGTPLPEAVLESIRRNRVALKGPITTPIGTGFRSVNVALRKELNLYALPAPLQVLSGHPHQVYRRGSCGGAREHGRPLRGRRIPGGLRRGRQDHRHGRRKDPAGQRDLDQADLPHRHAQHREIRLRSRGRGRAPESDRRRPRQTS